MERGSNLDLRGQGKLPKKGHLTKICGISSSKQVKMGS
jgi:hypothetical protein